ncbi:MAG: hypothetical protein ACD_17C00323G0001 [uncultured bacterium]|nr:MAG: hypothetical protein ACD_17C00323G0001 [uncultured bacterium]OGN56947.1 MAG: hypothetical protein A2796_06470 [Chlamydiae bacterium RIFCSPHIGHO2_01_FULL_44_39]OGN59388.1 MAG: hypothetical protein A3C42_05255 [Chlamydiae bacterium RIFCSPHIGHO2_02_FULL_45_9]OGN59640.1 MAG: hypothetical protein A3D96_06345 [Chlamydiae bacterium RIFCSPHIGHO2_12_FULL_44_59]OGN65730.1 MAG: hypothetical protein A2978_07340 [Chlamydiae bacterium RIFCSPLOWO2_01_FULL_44_52]OGN67872.1 MAG: hypothetical protein A3
MTVTSSPFRLVHLTTQLSEMGYFIVSAGSEWCCKGEGVGDLIAGILASQGYQRLLNQSGFCDVWISPLKDREITVKATRCMANLVEAELRVEAAAFPVTDWSLSSSKAFPDYIKLSSSAIKSWPNSKHLIAFSTQHAHVASFLVKNSLAEECIIVAGSFLVRLFGELSKEASRAVLEPIQKEAQQTLGIQFLVSLEENETMHFLRVTPNDSESRDTCMGGVEPLKRKGKEASLVQVTQQFDEMKVSYQEAQRMQFDGITHGRLRGARDIKQVFSKLGAGFQVTVSETPLSYVFTCTQGGQDKVLENAKQDLQKRLFNEGFTFSETREQGKLISFRVHG